MSRCAVRLATALCLLGFALLTGCHMGGFSATNLPPELTVPLISNVQALDLSRLAHSSFRTEAIYPGDVLEVTITTGAEDRAPPAWPIRVSHDGTLPVPQVGNVHIAGLELLQAEQAIRQASIDRKIYRHPNISVSIKDRRLNKVTVVGAVKKPDTYELPAAGSDLLAALTAAGGLTEAADTIVEIRNPNGHSYQQILPRGEGPHPSGNSQEKLAGYHQPPHVAARPVSYRVDLVSATSNANANEKYPLNDGAVVMVMKQEPRRIQVIGLVRNPAQYILPPGQDVRVLDALGMAGGRVTQLANVVHVIRQVPGSDEQAMINVSPSAAKKDIHANIRLAAGDVVYVEDTPLTFTVRTLKDIIRISMGITARSNFLSF